MTDHQYIILLLCACFILSLILTYVQIKLERLASHVLELRCMFVRNKVLAEIEKENDEKKK